MQSNVFLELVLKQFRGKYFFLWLGVCLLHGWYMYFHGFARYFSPSESQVNMVSVFTDSFLIVHLYYALNPIFVYSQANSETFFVMQKSADRAF